jgi:hypothetical protein
MEHLAMNDLMINSAFRAGDIASKNRGTSELFVYVPDGAKWHERCDEVASSCKYQPSGSGIDFTTAHRDYSYDLNAEEIEEVCRHWKRAFPKAFFDVMGVTA